MFMIIVTNIGILIITVVITIVCSSMWVQMCLGCLLIQCGMPSAIGLDVDEFFQQAGRGICLHNGEITFIECAHLVAHCVDLDANVAALKRNLILYVKELWRVEYPGQINLTFGGICFPI